MNTLQIKRVYEAPVASDGHRVLVDRLWPRGLSKAKADIDLWLRDIAPSDGLRKWYHGDTTKWDGFRERYFQELILQQEAVDTLLAQCQAGPVTLLYASRELQWNNAAALREYLVQRMENGVR